MTDSGRGSAGPTSSVRGCLANNSRCILTGKSSREWWLPCLGLLILLLGERSDRAVQCSGEVAELSGSSLSLPFDLLPSLVSPLPP